MKKKKPAVKSHYDRFLAGLYLWMAGEFEANAARNRSFFTAHRIAHDSSGIAIDLGAGCGFASIPLAEAGFRVTAVDFCQPLLDVLRCRAPPAAIETVTGDMLDFPLWAGKKPELIICTGDTLTHLPDHDSVSRVVRQCHAELAPGGKLVLSFRDYSCEEKGSITIIPVRRDADRIFLCRLEYSADMVMVTDILYSRTAGSWERSASDYARLRIAPGRVREMMEQTGFRIDLLEPQNGMVVIIGIKQVR